MSHQQRFVIAGAGLAAAKAAQTLREEGFDGDVTILGEEDEHPYERPPLSKGLLTGTAERDSIYVHNASWYTDNNIDLRTGTQVTHVNPIDQYVTLHDDTNISFEKLLLATGSSPRQLDVPGADLDGVCYLRRIEQSKSISDRLTSDSRIVIVGAGWIGLEIAAAARGRGAEVTIIEPQSVPLSSTMGKRMGGFFQDLHRSNDVSLRLKTTVTEIQGDETRVTGVSTNEGEHIPADTVIVGIGASPNVHLARAAGLKVDNGVLVDQYLRTDHPNIFAAGDIASIYRDRYQCHVRVEHWSAALETGPAAARNMLDQRKPYDEIPYFFTDQYDIGMEYVGWFPPGHFHKVVVRGDYADRKFYAFWLNHDRVIAGMHINMWDEGIAPVKQLIRNNEPVSTSRLTNPEISFGDATMR